MSQVALSVLLSTNELGISAAIVRWEGDVRSFARTVFNLFLMSSAALYAGLYALLRISRGYSAHRVRPACCASCASARSSTAPAPPRSPAHQGVRSGPSDGGRPAQLRGRHHRDGLAGVLRLGAMRFAGAGWPEHRRADRGDGGLPYFVLPGWNGAHAPPAGAVRAATGRGEPVHRGCGERRSAIVGATLGPAMLGLYQLAFNISSWPVTTIAQAVQRVSFAGFSRVADARQGMEDAFTRSLGLLMTLSVPHACCSPPWLSR